MRSEGLEPSKSARDDRVTACQNCRSHNCANKVTSERIELSRSKALVSKTSVSAFHHDAKTKRRVRKSNPQIGYSPVHRVQAGLTRPCRTLQTKRRAGVLTSHELFNSPDFESGAIQLRFSSPSGKYEIRTHGTFRLSPFPTACDRPGSANFPKHQSERRESNSRVVVLQTTVLPLDYAHIRRREDSNLRDVSTQRFSKPPRSASLPRLQIAPEGLEPSNRPF